MFSYISCVYYHYIYHTPKLHPHIRACIRHLHWSFCLTHRENVDVSDSDKMRLDFTMIW